MTFDTEIPLPLPQNLEESIGPTLLTQEAGRKRAGQGSTGRKRAGQGSTVYVKTKF